MKSVTLKALSARVDAALHQFGEISLKPESSGDYDSCCEPTLYISGRPDSEVFDMPKSGTAKVKYRIKSKTVRYEPDGRERYSTDIGVESIEPVDLEAILDKYLAFSDRSRDQAGRFAPGTAVTPADMADAYGAKKKKKQAMMVGGGAALATAAALGSRNPAIAGAVGRMLRR